MKEQLWEYRDTEWPFTYTDHDRLIVRAIVFDDAGYFYFVRVRRNDQFGKATLIDYDNVKHAGVGHDAEVQHREHEQRSGRSGA